MTVPCKVDSCQLSTKHGNDVTYRDKDCQYWSRCTSVQFVTVIREMPLPLLSSQFRNKIYTFPFMTGDWPEVKTNKYSAIKIGVDITLH